MHGSALVVALMSHPEQVLSHLLNKKGISQFPFANNVRQSAYEYTLLLPAQEILVGVAVSRIVILNRKVDPMELTARRLFSRDRVRAVTITEGSGDVIIILPQRNVAASNPGRCVSTGCCRI